jgi:serralysin
VPVALSDLAGFTTSNVSAPGFASLAANPDVTAVSGDFNGDGKADLALINQDAGWNTVPVALTAV